MIRNRLFSFVVLLILLLFAAVPNGSVGAAPNPGRADSSRLAAAADVTITQVAESDSISKGDTARFNITVKNAGTGTANNVVLTDALSQSTGLSWSIVTPVQGCSIANKTLTCTFGSLTPGATRAVSISSPTANVGCCCKISNTANVTATNEADAYLGNNSSLAKILVNCPPTGANVTVTKKAVTSPVNPGDPISFEITVKSTGDQAATDVILTDDLPTTPAGLSWSLAAPVTGCSIANNKLSCSFASLDPGASQTVTVTSPTVGIACGTTISNTATVSAGNEGSGNDGDNSSTGEVTIACPPVQTVDVEVTKTAVATPVDQGKQVGFVMKVTNNSLETAKGVTLTDMLPAGTGLSWSVNPPVTGCSITNNTLTCSFGDMAANASQTVTITSETVGAACGTISNTAKVSATNESNNNDPDDSATATLDLVNCPGAGLKVVKTADANPINANDMIGFTITVSNPGGAAATGVVLDDQLDGRLTWSVTPPVTGCSLTGGSLACNLGNITAGDSVAVHVTAKTSAAVCGRITNTAFAEAANVTQTQSDPAVVDIVNCIPGVNVKVTKTAEKASLFGGQPAVFTITTANDSANLATGVVLTDALPAGLTWTWTSPEPNLPCGIAANKLTCNFGDLASGVSHTLTITAQTFKYAGPITNTAVVSATNETAGNQGDNTSTATTSVLAQACLSLNMFNGKYNNSFSGAQADSIGITNYKADVTPKNEGFMGQYAGNDEVTLTLTCLPNNTGKLLVSFNLFIIRSWDGNTTGNGPDHWKFSVDNGPVLLDTTFTNFSTYPQAYPGNWPASSRPAYTGAVGIDVLGFTNSGAPTWPQDSLYYLTFEVPYVQGQPITLRFSGSNLQPLLDESWGIDNLQVVPVPLALGDYKLYFPMWFK